jgi:hypothetical protein
MFPLKFINRHFFLEHEGRLYLVDTGCPRSFAINSAIPWANKTPQAVILDVPNGLIRFHREEEPFYSAGLFDFEKAPRTMAPILASVGRNHDPLRLIWDTGAQIGYVDMADVPAIALLEETGPFSDFSPTYGTIESGKTWRARFFIKQASRINTSFDFFAFCQIAQAPQRILDDIKSEGAHGVLGNSWMNECDCAVVAIKAKKAQLHIRGGSWMMRKTTGGPIGSLDWLDIAVVTDEESRPETPIDRKITTHRRLAQLSQAQESLEAKAQDPELSGLPQGIQATGLTPTLRSVPCSLGPFTVEGLRAHLGMDNIDGLIGNDLLLDTLL